MIRLVLVASLWDSSAKAWVRGKGKRKEEEEEPVAPCIYVSVLIQVNMMSFVAGKLMTTISIINIDHVLRAPPMTL